MQFSSIHLLVLAVVGIASAQRPSSTPICDFYTTALLKENNATNQQALITLVVNTAVIGNYTKPNVGIAVPGILAKGKYNGTNVDLAPYFSGALKSTNRGGESGVSVNFLDDGGAAPLMQNKPSNGTDSNQHKLLTHLYEFFGALLGCSEYGKTGFEKYSGFTGLYEVHKFMALDPFEVQYFIEQVGMSAASFGVSMSDVRVVGETLNTVFGHKCAPAAAVLPDAKSELQAICIADDCPLSANATCSKYEAVVEPASNSSSGGSDSGGNGTSSGSNGTTQSGGSAMGSTPILGTIGTLLIVVLLGMLNVA